MSDSEFFFDVIKQKLVNKYFFKKNVRFQHFCQKMRALEKWCVTKVAHCKPTVACIYSPFHTFLRKQRLRLFQPYAMAIEVEVQMNLFASSLLFYVALWHIYAFRSKSNDKELVQSEPKSCT